MATTHNVQRAHVGFAKQTTFETGSYPPASLEYAWYASLIYAYLGQAWGIVIPSLGGAILVLVAAGCLWSVGDQALLLCKPVAWGFYTGIFVLAIQVLFHDTTVMALPEVIAFVVWLALLFIVQSLSLRPGFLQRFALVALAIGLACLPFISIKEVDGVKRAWASGTGISNPNVLGMWFGFCTVYFIFWGLQSRRFVLRTASWTAAVGCFYIVTLSVSRAPLLGIILACIVGFRSALKKSFVPLLSFVLLVCLVYVSGVFDEEIGYYTARGDEESGRGRLWPMALDRIVYSPWVGDGLDNIGILSRSGRLINPHNGLLHIALGAGIVPLICFVCYLWRAVIGAFRIMLEEHGHGKEAALLPPLVMFGLFETMVLDYTFMSPWAAVVFGLAASAAYGIGRQRAMTDKREDYTSARHALR